MIVIIMYCVFSWLFGIAYCNQSVKLAQRRKDWIDYLMLVIFPILFPYILGSSFDNDISDEEIEYQIEEENREIAHAAFLAGRDNLTNFKDYWNNVQEFDKDEPQSGF